MILNYLKIAWRNIVKRAGYSFINIGGLAVGIAACLLLFTVVRYELSYNTSYNNHQQIYRLSTKVSFPGGDEYTPGMPFPALEAIKTTFPGYTTGALFASYGSQVTVMGENRDNTSPDKKFIEEEGVFFSDPGFFQLFNHHWLAGTASVLGQPNTTVLSKGMAEKYFDDWRSAVGKYLKLDNKATVKVEGVIDNAPANSDFPLKIVTSLATAKANADTYGYSAEDWGNTTSNFQLYTLLPKGSSADQVNQQLVAFSKDKYKNETIAKKVTFLQPLSELHFDNRFGNFGDHITSKSTLWTLSLIGLFIIIMASINFINLSTSQAVGRSKEVGIRKVLGSNRKQLFGQAMGETGLIVLLSTLVGVALSVLCLPYIRHIASIEEQLSIFNLQSVAFVLVLILFVTLFAGLYPSLILSSFKPALALKNKITSATVGGISIRRGLVITQFAISQVLIIGTIIAISQMNFIRNADLGYNKEALFIINAAADSIVHSRQEAFKQKLLQLPGVQSVSFSSDVPSSESNWSGNFAYNHKDDKSFNIYRKAGDEDFFKTYGLQIVAGRGFGKSDTANEIVLNETVVKMLGIKDPNQVLGKDIRTGRSSWKTIVGVVKDFKTNSLREDVKPTMLFARRDRYGVTGIKLKSQNLAATQAAIEATWNEFYPEYAYTSSFMDKNISDFYKQEEQLSLLYKIFAGIAIFISCLGLYGLVSFMSLQRTKEIGIRKVLGASVQNIIYLFSKEFTILIVVGFVLAAPVAYYMMNSWLENFAFRIKISMGVFALAILTSIIIAWITVGYKSVSAAIRNPVDSLKIE